MKNIIHIKTFFVIPWKMRRDKNNVIPLLVTGVHPLIHEDVSGASKQDVSQRIVVHICLFVCRSNLKVHCQKSAEKQWIFLVILRNFKV